MNFVGDNKSIEQVQNNTLVVLKLYTSFPMTFTVSCLKDCKQFCLQQ